MDYILTTIIAILIYESIRYVVITTYQLIKGIAEDDMDMYDKDGK